MRNSTPFIDERKIHAAQLLHATGLLHAYGYTGIGVDRLVAKAFRYTRLADDDERRWGGRR